jgi:esterase/lipase superfamily enzyme
MEILVFGHGGAPVIVFPTSMGRFYDYEDRGMVSALAGPLERGTVQLFCVDSVDAESLYNRRVSPRARIVRHTQFDRYVLTEVIPFALGKTPDRHLVVTGCSFGGYHAVNFALRHPAEVRGCISLSGVFDIKPFLDGHYDDDVYFNNPVDYLPNLNDDWYLHRFRTRLRLVLAAGEHDNCLDANLKLSGILRDKGVNHHMDVWGDGTGHDWPWWRSMAATYMQGMIEDSGFRDQPMESNR